MEISKKITKIEFKDRFSLFEISNFLEDETYNKLNLSFPNQALFSPHNDFASSFSDESDQFSDFLRNNPYWKNFIEEINSKIFVEDLIKFFNLKKCLFFQK